MQEVCICVSESDVPDDVRCPFPDGCREAASPGAGASRAGKTGVNGAAEGAAEGLSVKHHRGKQEANSLPPTDTTRECKKETQGSDSYLNRSKLKKHFVFPNFCDHLTGFF